MAEYQARPSFLENGSSCGNVLVGRNEKRLIFTNSGDRNKVENAWTSFEISINLLVLLTGSVIYHVVSGY